MELPACRFWKPLRFMQREGPQAPAPHTDRHTTAVPRATTGNTSSATWSSPTECATQRGGQYQHPTSNQLLLLLLPPPPQKTKYKR
jgi:hypothetical protein